MSEVQRVIEDLTDHLDYPMVIVTAAAGERRSGCLVGFWTQCSVDPAGFAVFISENNHTHAVAMEAESLGVHVVPRGREDLARLFGETTGDDTDKFDLCEWEPGPSGAPILVPCKDWFEGRVVQKIEAGDHTGFVVEPTHGEAAGEGFFPFSLAKDFDPGHEA